MTFHRRPLATSASLDLPPMSLTLPKQPGISIQKCEPVGNIVGSNHDKGICSFCVPALEDINLI